MMRSTGSHNIAAHLPEMASRLPETPAIHCPAGRDRQGRVRYAGQTFRELEQASNRFARGLAQAGIGRGVRTVLMVKPGPEFFALTFALFKIGAVPVMIDPGMGVKNLKACLVEAAPEAFVGIPKAHAARVLFGWGKASLKILVTVGRRLFWAGTTLQSLTADMPADQSYAPAPTASDELAAVLFTSGSTGVPKGAVYTHGNFMAQVEALRQLYDIRPGEVDLPTFPLFALFAPALGMTSVIPDMDFTRPANVDPSKIIDAIQRFQVTNMFGSPALLKQVGAYGAAQSARLPSLKRVVSAGAPVPAKVLERFVGLLDAGTEVFTPYGATEALPVCSIGSHEILAETRQLTEQGRGVCIGKPVAGLHLELIRISDAPIDAWHDSLRVTPGEIGEIVVRGPQVTGSYLNRPDLTRLAKIPDAARNGFWHRMGDLGYCDAFGRVWFCGRKDHRVVLPDTTLYTIPCEAIFNTHPLVGRSALVGIGERGRQRPVLCVETEPGIAGKLHGKLREELLAIGRRQPMTRPIRDILFHPAFPVDIRHNAKIFREKLALWAAGQLS